jgi:hypothetical protein
MMEKSKSVAKKLTKEFDLNRKPDGGDRLAKWLLGGEDEWNKKHEKKKE